MDNFLYFYQHIPYYLNPTAFSVGNFKVDWYSLMYLVGFGVVYYLLRYRIIKDQNSFFANTKCYILDTKKLFDLLFWIFIGLLIGARLGYVLFYDLPYFLNNPLAIISPFDTVGNFVGLYGMSYHGGLIGAVVAFLIFIKKNKLSFWRISDFIIPAIPAGYFFGRIGNFLNGELWGRATDKFWGMYFSEDSPGLLRHPSQLYEAFLEGLVLFIVLWFWRNNKKLKNKFLGVYLIGYALMRIICEFFRQPDAQIGYILNLFTLGQILSLIMVVAGIILLYNTDNAKYE